MATTTEAHLDAVLSAASDPTRRAILQRLAHGPATAGQLAELFPISRPAVSQHLKILRVAMLIRASRSGRQRWYELAPRRLFEAEEWFRRIAVIWSKAPGHSHSQEKARQPQ